VAYAATAVGGLSAGLKALGDDPSAPECDGEAAALVAGRDRVGCGTDGTETPNCVVSFLLFDVEGGGVSVL
jgi:hypothetical protein